ncbi:MAG TPA: type II toxin-antitoxin system RelE/ParE family toxin [Bdellovibrionota bacterium]|nr:type II toxin-antitoxin system RelE/ParE family toxin [Bdellovibrionota bacterium]
MRVRFHVSRTGRSYVADFLDELDVRSRADILAVLQDIRNHGFGAVGCRFRQIEGKLWEIKIGTSGGAYRFFYVMLAASEMYVLHAYKKKTSKAPPREIEVARKRLKEVLP